MYPIHAYGTEEQRKKWLPKLQSGEAIGCFGLTEPGFGSNPAGMKTTARREGDGWVLNGEKTWITNGTPAHVAIIWARATDDAGAVRGFLVEKGTPGYTTSVELGWSRAEISGALSVMLVVSGLAGLGVGRRFRACHRRATESAGE